MNPGVYESEYDVCPEVAVNDVVSLLKVVFFMFTVAIPNVESNKTDETPVPTKLRIVAPRPAIIFPPE